MCLVKIGNVKNMKIYNFKHPFHIVNNYGDFKKFKCIYLLLEKKLLKRKNVIELKKRNMFCKMATKKSLISWVLSFMICKVTYA
jgi:hypothetical protein